MTDQSETPEPIEEGRRLLENFRDAVRDHHAFEDDPHFKRLVDHYADPDRRDDLVESLRQFGAGVTGRLDELIRTNNARGNEPQLNRWSDYGTRLEEIDHHPTYHEAGEAMYGSGVMAAYADYPNSVGALSRFYLTSLNGEAGHNCPIACTAGVIRVLYELADDELRDRYLDGFLNPEYGEHLEGAQFLTEVQGGSDVGANGTRAVRADDGTWRIRGEKWFCSNIDADVFLMTARIENLDEEGTAGLGLFFVPRQLEGGEVNDFSIRRLKDKLGTRSMASAECDFNGAVAYHLGDVGQGFRNMMSHVINTSRLYNAVGCCSMARRAFVTAKTYAEHREAFGRTIGDYPLVRETLADMRAETETMLAATMHLAALQDRIDAGETTDREEQFFRMALNLNKSRTAKSAREVVVDGIEVLGGNGAIETFSVLPRLLRDSVVFENWEGTHNTLYMQVWRDMKRRGVHRGFFDVLDGMLTDVEDNPEVEQTEQLGDRLTALQNQTREVLERPVESASLAMRRLVDDLTFLLYGVVRARHRAQFGQREGRVGEASLEHFLDRRVREGDPEVGDPAYLDRISLLSGMG